ncbi:hypothetical protein ACUNGZ_27225, partial [Serratia sp. IR-2025]
PRAAPPPRGPPPSTTPRPPPPPPPTWLGGGGRRPPPPPRNQPMLLVDIAVPRDIEPEVGKLANAYLYSVDDLHAIIQSNLAQRKAAAVQAESIVQQESTNFMAWLRSQGAVETIRDYRSQADQIRAEMEAKALAAIAQGANVEQVIHELAHKLTNRLIHAPTKSLQQAAGDGDVERLQLLRDSLGLDQH